MEFELSDDELARTSHGLQKGATYRVTTGTGNKFEGRLTRGLRRLAKPNDPVFEFEIFASIAPAEFRVRRCALSMLSTVDQITP